MHHVSPQYWAGLLHWYGSLIEAVLVIHSLNSQSSLIMPSSLSPLPQRISSVHRIAVLSTIYSFIQLHKISTNDRHELAGSSLCIQQHLHLGHSVAQNFTKTEQWLHSCRRFILLGPHISYKLKIVCSYEIADVCVYIYIYTGGPPYLWIQYPQF